jgi:hypothetical protein
MAETARLQTELAESKAEIQSLKERLSVGVSAVHKNLSLIALIPKWGGSESGETLEVFISTVDTSARIGNWGCKTTLEIAILKLSGSAKMFYQGRQEFHAQDASWKLSRMYFGKDFGTFTRTNITT